MDDFIGRTEAEGGRVADIQLEYMGSCFFHASRFVDDGTPDIIENVIKFGGFLECAHGGSFPVVRLRFGKRGFGVGVQFFVRLNENVAALGFTIDSRQQPIRVNVKKDRKHVGDIGARNGFAAYVLTELALAKLLA